MYYSTGSHCELKVDFEDWEDKYSPGDWSSANLFETLLECCNAKFWYDVPKCLADSPKDLVFFFSFGLQGLVEPATCQDADTIGNALEVALGLGLGGGNANVT